MTTNLIIMNSGIFGLMNLLLAICLIKYIRTNVITTASQISVTIERREFCPQNESDTDTTVVPLRTRKPRKTCLHFFEERYKNISAFESENKTLNMTLERDAMHRLVWIDLELTGLDLDKDLIMEAACIITEGNLDIVAVGPQLIIHQPKEILDNMTTWCQVQHGKSGLTEASLNSTLTVEAAEKILLDFVKQYTPPGKCCVAGNSVYMDRFFIQKYMPLLDHHLNYRIVDVSSIKELCKRWNYFIYNNAIPKQLSHRALDDIYESIYELQYYRSKFFHINEKDDK